MKELNRKKNKTEDETNSCWESLAVEKGFSETASTVTLFAADGMQGIVDQKSRDPESLSRSFAAALRVVGHPKMILASDAILVVSPEHERIYRQAGWAKQDVKNYLNKILTIDGLHIMIDTHMDGSITIETPTQYSH